MTDNMEKESTSRNKVLLQSNTQIEREMTYSNNVKSDFSTNFSTASMDTTDLETYSQLSQTETTIHGPHDHSSYMSDSYTLEDTLIRSKQLQNGRVPEALQYLAATEVDESDLDTDLEKVMDGATKQDEKANIDCNKDASIQQKQSQDEAIVSSLSVSSFPTRPLVLPASAKDSVRQFYVSPTLPATASRQIANPAVNSLSQQSNVVNNASSTQPEALLVAVPVEEEEVHGYAVSQDVSKHEQRYYKQVQMVRARRYTRRLYFGVFLLVAAAVMIASIVVINSKKSDEQVQETETEMTFLQNMTQLIVTILGADAVLLNNTLSPYAKALTWLLQSNGRIESQVTTSRLAQRFFLASFYYDTTTDDDEWTDCNPPKSSSELDQTCNYSYFNTTARDVYNATAQAWLSDSHECEWAGVRCDYQQQITELEFENMNLMGTIPSCTTKFPFLQRLRFSSSRLEGNISLLSSFRHLTYIVLNNNLLSGDLFPVWQNRKLLTFSARNNYFNGSLSLQIGNLVDLQYLSLYSNNLTGTVPSAVGWFDSIFQFDISSNYFQGKLPWSMQFWSKIQYLFVGQNSLSGSIPTFLGQLNKTLEDLDLHDNSFTGTLPDELFHLSELFELDVSNNELSGTLDARFTQLISSQYNTSIFFLDLSGNHFSGTIPTELGLLNDLYVISLQGNDFHGSVPTSVCNNSYIDGFTFYADCAKNNNGQVELQCDCCTQCF